MNLRAYLLLSVVVYLIFIAGCQQNPTEPTTTKASSISGTVLDAANKPLPLARVIDMGSLAPVDTSKPDGSFILKMELTDNYNTSLIAILTGYASDTLKVSLAPGDNKTGVTIHMTVQDSSKIIAGNSGPPASIVLKSPTPGSIALRGTGINETAVLTFVVKDSMGNPVVGNNRCIVKFRLSARPDTLTSLNPSSAETNQLTGEVSTTILAGITPGVLQVIASTRGDTVKASPVFLAAGGGLPDSAGVSMGASPINIAGRLYGNLVSTITMFVNDRWGNPVANGTKVSFVTTAGSIVSSTTSQDGLASVQLKSTLNFPTNPLVILTATTNGDKYYRPSDSSIVRHMPILFSGPTAPIALDTSTTNRFDVPDGGTKFFRFRVSDDLGYPLVAGSTITITVDGADTLTKNIAILGSSYTFPDEQSPLATYFSVGIVDKLFGGGSGSITIGIHVTSTNGSTERWFGGRILPSGAVSGSTFNGPASIAAVDTISKRLYFLETQKPDTVTKLTFIVKDAYGAPMQSANKAQVQFFLSGAPAGVHFYPSMKSIPVTDSTDAKGTVSVMVVSGNTPGTFTLQARTTNGVNTYDASSVPIIIRHGLPDSNFISSDIKKNIFNPKSSVRVGTFTLNLEDYTSDIPAPSNIFFTTTGGSIGALAISDSNSGKAIVNLFGGKEPSDPVRGPGWGNILATLLVHGGTTITQSFPFLFSYAPKISFTDPSIVNTTTNSLITWLADGEERDIPFSVLDKNNNPISSNNAIKVSVSGSVAQDIELSGDTMRNNLPDTQNPTDGNFKISIKNKAGGVGGAFTITIIVSGESGNISQTLNGNLAAPTGGLGESGYASSIQLLSGSPSASTISVKGTGATETSTMSFVVKDSLGNPVSTSRQATVTFRIVPNPTDGAFLSPTSAVTDANGKVTTTVNAGTKSGVMQVVAVIGTIQSAPVPLTIASGRADPAHFTVWTDKQNLPGMISQGIPIGNVQVQIGDKYGNPVQPNTAVYFSATGGIITSSAFTDATGHLTPPVIVYGGNPIPPGGIDTITVFTLGQSPSGGDTTITQKVTTVYSGSPIITFPGYGTGTLPPISDGGFIDNIEYDITDANGNPISSNNNITASLSGAAASQLTLSLDVAPKTTDTKLAADQHYKLKLTDPTQGSGSGGPFTLTISVSGPSVPAGTSSSKSLTGYLQAPGIIGSGGTGRAKSIVLVSTSATDISVKGTGSSETASLIFEARDSLGQAIDLNHSTTMIFSISAPDLGASLTIPSAVTDASGRATTLVQSGTKSGVIQVQASTVIDGITVSSLPIRLSINSGLPDQTHFTIGPQKFNFPGLDFNGLTDDITIQMGDTYSNPVQTGTVAYFNTTAGIIQTTGSTTSSNGFITKTLYSANPRPEGSDATVPPPAGYGGPGTNNGWTRVYSRTEGPNGTTVMDSIEVLWTGRPFIINTGATTFAIPDGGGAAGFSFSVSDRYGHPLSAGTSISLAAAGLKVSSDCPDGGLPDTWVTGPGFTTFSATLADASPGTNPPITVNTQLVLTVTHPVYGTFKVIIAAGTYE